MIHSVSLLSLCKQTSMTAYTAAFISAQKGFFHYKDSNKTENPLVSNAGIGYQKEKFKRPMRHSSSLRYLTQEKCIPTF